MADLWLYGLELEVTYTLGSKIDGGKIEIPTRAKARGEMMQAAPAMSIEVPVRARLRGGTLPMKVRANVEVPTRVRMRGEFQ